MGERPSGAVMGHQRDAADSDGAFATTLEDILAYGHEVIPGQSLSVGSSKPFREILNYHLTVRNPRQRLLRTSARFYLPGAVARFVWMMAANDRLMDIEFYFGPRITPFSDDGVLVPGSSYGHRMLQPEPGLDQLAAVIKRLKVDPGTRRAAIAVYQAEDAVRESRDIPCTFGLFFHIRDEALHASVIMRSNNALTLLLYNLFEFSLLAEAVAAELRQPLGTLSHTALSMHIFGDGYERAQQLLDRPDKPTSNPVPAIPYGDSAAETPMAQIKALVRLEAEARHAAAGFAPANFDEWLRRGDDQLIPYWQQFYLLLLLHMASKYKLRFALDQIEQRLTPPWKEALDPTIFRPLGEVVPRPTQADLLERPVGSLTVMQSPNTTFRNRLRSFQRRVIAKSGEVQARGEPPIAIDELFQLQTVLIGSLDEAEPLAASSVDAEVTDEEITQALNALRAR